MIPFERLCASLRCLIISSTLNFIQRERIPPIHTRILRTLSSNPNPRRPIRRRGEVEAASEPNPRVRVTLRIPVPNHGVALPDAHVGNVVRAPPSDGVVLVPLPPVRAEEPGVPAGLDVLVHLQVLGVVEVECVELEVRPSVTTGANCGLDGVAAAEPPWGQGASLEVSVLDGRYRVTCGLGRCGCGC